MDCGTCRRISRGRLRLRTHRLRSLNGKDAKRIRKKLGFSQSVFAALLGVSLRTLQEWEQMRREPRGPAQALLRVADRHPEALL
ncbi:MAG: helix-turn-helix domain-containing protein [Proteobacteria bacterium]|nr:helix-turn-helix domain-containing protein [Pseudomonadota bacterium]